MMRETMIDTRKGSANARAVCTASCREATRAIFVPINVHMRVDSEGRLNLGLRVLWVSVSILKTLDGQPRGRATLEVVKQHLADSIRAAQSGHSE